MDADTTLAKVIEKHEPDSESGQSDFIPSKSTSKVIKNFMKCICELIQHVENVLSNSNTAQSNNEQDIEILENSIKEEFGEAIRYLQSIKKCCLQLSLLCVDQNIYVDCTLDFKIIDFYNFLDDSTRSLVVNYLTENIVYLIEHIGYIISMFKEEKNIQEAKDIRKSLQKIFKQILFIPLNPNLDETPVAFQNLNTSQWQSESMQNLIEKLSLLRTALIKFRKTFKKRIFSPDSLFAADNSSSFFQNIDITPSNLKRKNGYISDESTPKKLKNGNGLASPSHVFLVPDTPSDTENHKKKKYRNQEISDSDTTLNESDSDKKKKKKYRNQEISDSDTTLNESDSDKKKKKKHKYDNDETESVISVTSDTDSIKRKKKSKIKTENDVTEISDTESVNSKKKQKIVLENHEPNTESVKHKKKHKLKSENSEVINCDNKENNDHSESITILNTPEKNNKTKDDSHVFKTPEKKNKNMNGSDIFKTPEKKNKSMNDSDIFKTPEKRDSLNNSYKTPEKKNRSLNNSQNSISSEKNNRSRNDSLSSVVSISQLYTSRLDIEDAEVTIDKHNKTKDIENHESQNIAKNKLEKFMDKYQSKKAKKLKKKSNKNVDEFFEALSRGELEVDYEDDTESLFNEICREKHLNENEKFIYIQEMLLEAKEKHELSEEMKEKLTNLHVLIDWEIPESHKVEKRLSAGPLPDELPMLAALGVTNKKWNQDDDKIIRRNWENFYKLHELDSNPSPFFKLRHGRKGFLNYEERIKFVQFLGKDLPHRALHSIFRRFKVLLRNEHKLGRFTPQEDEIILNYCNKVNHEHCYADLEMVLKRDRVALERRYRKLKQKSPRIRWTIELDAEIIHGLLKATRSKDVEDLRNKKIEREYFKKVANEMKVPWEKIKVQWWKNIYTKLFAREVLHAGQIRVKIIKLLNELDITDWKEVDWNEFVTEFDGYSKEFLFNQLCLIQSLIVPKNLQRKLGEMLVKCNKYINQMTVSNMQPFSSKLIRRYKYEDGKLVTFV